MKKGRERERLDTKMGKRRGSGKRRKMAVGQIICAYYRSEVRQHMYRTLHAGGLMDTEHQCSSNE